MRLVGKGPMFSVNRPIIPTSTRKPETAHPHQVTSWRAFATPRLCDDLLQEACFEQLLAMHGEERVDAVAHDAHDLALAPPRVAHDVALLERAEHGAFYPLDLERTTAASGAA